jgi:hypothetical protein
MIDALYWMCWGGVAVISAIYIGAPFMDPPTKPPRGPDGYA